MKRFLLIPTCAVVALGTLTSCQKEEKTALELSQELTEELQKVTGYQTAEAAAPRVEAINKRFQNAGARIFAVGGSALARSAGESGHEGDAYAESLAKLAREVGRIRASMPVAEAVGDVDRDRLVLAVGAANGAGDAASAAERKDKGLAYMHSTAGGNETPGTFSEYYGSTKLKEALEFIVEPGKATDEVPEIPAAVSAEEEPMPADTPAADTESDTTDTPAATGSDDEEETTTDTPSVDDSADTDEPAADDSSDSSDTSSDDSGDLPSLDDDSSDSSDSAGSDDSEDVDVSIDLDL